MSSQQVTGYVQRGGPYWRSLGAKLATIIYPGEREAALDEANLSAVQTPGDGLMRQLLAQGQYQQVATIDLGTRRARSNGAVVQFAAVKVRVIGID